MLHLIKTKMFLSLTNHDNNPLKIPLLLSYREAYYKGLLFFPQKTRFMEKLVLNDHN